MQKIPVFINNRNRLYTLKCLVEWLRDKNVEIVILDNNSDYPPLISYYESLDCQVVHLGKNMGNTAIYQWGKYMDYPGRFFIYTDSDLVPKEECPSDLIDHLIFLKQKYATKNKAGTSLEINDIPDFYPFKQNVLDWELKFWQNEQNDFYEADVDTTFAAYDKLNYTGRNHCVSNCIRSKRPYVMRHFPWYNDMNNLSEEECYYLKSADALLPNGDLVGMWTQKHRFFRTKIF